MRKKQTAIDFLIKEISDILGPIKSQPMQDLLLVDAINKAKKIEKQNIIDACREGEAFIVPNNTTTKLLKENKK